MILRRHRFSLRFAIGLLALMSAAHLAIIFVDRNVAHTLRLDTGEGFLEPSASPAWTQEQRREAADNKRGVALLRDALVATGLDHNSIYNFTNGQPLNLHALTRLVRRIEATRNPSRHSNGLNPAETLVDVGRFPAGAGQKLHEFWMAFFGDGRGLERYGTVPPEWIVPLGKSSTRQELNLRDANREHLARLAHFLRDQGGQEALCRKHFPPRRPPALGPLQWLHVPKSGTSFANTLLPWASGDAWPPEVHLGRYLAQLRV